MRDFVHYIPILTTFVAFTFAYVILKRYRERRTGPHLAWWGAGIVLYGVGTLTEALVTLFGWNAVVFRSWYIAGALLGAAPLAQGTVYLLLRRRTAHRLTAILVPYILVAATCVLLTPLNYELVETYRLSGAVIEWRWVRLFSPFINIYAFIFLVGGAALSAVRYSRHAATRHRFIGNALIAFGAVLPGIGGTATRMGYTEVLYVTEFLGLAFIWWGYHWVVSGAPHAAAAAPGRGPVSEQAVVP